MVIKREEEENARRGKAMLEKGGEGHTTLKPLTYCVVFELPSQSSTAVSVWLKRICWVTLFGMRLQQTVNSPTRWRIIQHKQAEMEEIIKPELISVRLKQQLIIPSHSFTPSVYSCQSLPLSFFLSPLLMLPLLPLLSIRLFFPPSPPFHSCCLGNNTKRFSLQLCHRGNAWLSSWPSLDVCCPLVHSSQLVLTTFKSSIRQLEITADAAISDMWGDADSPRWSVWGCWRFTVLIVSRQTLSLFKQRRPDLQSMRRCPDFNGFTIYYFVSLWSTSCNSSVTRREKS